MSIKPENSAKPKYLSYFFILTMLIGGCSADPNDETVDNPDCIPLGYAFYPGVFFSSDPQNYVDNYDSDIMLFHFGDNVPWTYLQDCPDMSCADQEFTDLINTLATHANLHNGIVYLSVSALHNDRNAPSNDWNGDPPPADNFADQELRDLYKEWVKYLVENLEPDYISQGIEVNMYALEHPEDFPNLVSLLKEVKEMTENVVGPSIQWEFYRMQSDQGNAPEIPFDELGTGLVLSTYPHLFDPASTAQVISTHFDFSAYDITVDGPLFIAESGIQHHAQASLLNTLFGLENLEGFIWFFKEDANEYFSQHTGYPFTIFENSGIYADDGTKNPGASIWEENACPR